jgi:16S rRNA (uracil1498-N3)-methyltransferase
MGETRRIDGNAAHYLAQVMRAKPGDAVILCDNISGEWAARVSEASKRHVDLELVERLREREDVPDVWLCVAPVKKPHFDLMLEKATELGVGTIQPVLTRRCVVDKVNEDRVQTITTEAAEQCARTTLPVIQPLVPLTKLLKDWPENRLLFFADELGGDAALGAFANVAGRHAPAALLIGPEGGFDDAERTAIRAHPCARPISLGPRILRAETAAIAALALWMAVAGDWEK